MTNATGLTPVESRRLTRIAASWRADAVHPEDVRRARMRLRSRPQIASWVALSRQFLLAAVSTAALVLGIDWVTGKDSAPLAPPSAVTAAAPPGPMAAVGPSRQTASASPARKSYVRTTSGQIQLSPGLRLSLGDNETASVVLANRTTTVAGPTLLEFHLDPEAASGWRMERLPPRARAAGPAARSGSTTAGVPTPHRDRPAAGDKIASADESSPGIHLGATPEGARPKDTGAWQRAARALEAQRLAEADSALDELTKSHDHETRDAAWLARAQLWISRGEPERARPILAVLAERGATPLVRKRAADLLSP